MPTTFTEGPWELEDESGASPSGKAVNQFRIMRSGVKYSDNGLVAEIFMPDCNSEQQGLIKRHKSDARIMSMGLDFFEALSGAISEWDTYGAVSADSVETFRQLTNWAYEPSTPSKTAEVPTCVHGNDASEQCVDCDDIGDGPDEDSTQQ